MLVNIKLVKPTDRDKGNVYIQRPDRNGKTWIMYDCINPNTWNLFVNLAKQCNAPSMREGNAIITRFGYETN